MTETQGVVIPRELRDAIRKEAIQQTAKWAIGALLALVGFALAGWWLYLKPKIIEVVGGVPSAAVVAFDIRDKCPEGWTAFETANSRFIIAAGKGDDLTARQFGATGGNERHSLTLREMPAHTHSYIDWRAGPGSCTFSGCNGTGGDQTKTTGVAGGTETGATEPFEIMPPFLALRFCKKD